MYALNIDSDNRILSVTSEEYAVDGMPLVEELPDGDISLYRFLDGDFIPNEEEVSERAKEEKAKQIQELTSQLRATDSQIIDAIEKIFGCKSITEFITTLISAGDGIKDTLAQRKTIREQIETAREE